MEATQKKNALFRFLITAGLTYVILYLIHQFLIKRYTFYDQKFISGIIFGANEILQLFGYKTNMILQDRDLQVIYIDGSNGVWVGSNCNAISLFILFVVFIAWYPGHQKSKLWFIPFGIVSIHILNILRVVCLAIIAKKAPGWLDFNHSYTFTFLIYAYIFSLWVWWVNKFSNKNSKSS